MAIASSVVQGGAIVTLEQAVAILKDRRHHGHSKWYISGNSRADSVVYGKDQYECFEPFEAIAIAEKYQAESMGESGQ